MSAVQVKKPRSQAMGHWTHLAAGVSGGVCSTLVLHPLDLVKIRFQVNEGISAPLTAPTVKRPQYKGISHALLTIARSKGIRGLYQGVGPNVWGAGASWGLYFFFYNALKTRLIDKKNVPFLSAGQHMLVAAEAGVFTLVLCNPIWVAKTRMCLQYDMVAPKAGEPVTAATVVYKNMADALVKIYKYEGVTGLYKGFVPGAFGVSHGALQFMAYEELKKMYNKRRNVPMDTKFSNLEYLSFAAISKMFAACSTYPYQVVRARLQDQHRSYDGVRDCLRQIWRHEGTYGFYKGLVPGLLRVTPACCITFVVYENLSAYLLKRFAAR